MGIEGERIRLEWISASEADRLKSVVDDMVERLRALGPSRWETPEEVFEEEVSIA
jgi:F420-non-reducing hydrogenase iron-sulfur subunit